jgi:hypothetical protein
LNKTFSHSFHLAGNAWLSNDDLIISIIGTPA